MKVIGDSSLSSFLKWVLDLFWVFWLICVALVLGLGVVRIVVPSVDGPLSLPIFLFTELEGLDRVPLLAEGAAAKVDEAVLEVAFTAPSRALVAVSVTFYLLSAALGTVVFFHLRKVLGSLTAGQMFTRTNARALRFIAFASLGTVLVDEAWSLFGRWYLGATVRFASGTPTFPWPEFDDLFWALILIVIAEAARIGAALEEERALTV